MVVCRCFAWVSSEFLPECWKEREFVVPGPDLLGRVLRDSALSAAESVTQPLFHIRMERVRM